MILIKQNAEVQNNINSILLGEAPDSKGRYYEDYINQSHLQLEISHDYIQYMFPTDIPSRYVNTPIISMDEAYILGQNETVRMNLYLATRRMIWFFNKKKIWHRHDHNFKRISRILRCLRIFGLDDDADLFYDFAVVPLIGAPFVDRKTEEYWWKCNLKVGHR